MKTFTHRIAWIQATRLPSGTVGKERLTRPSSSASKNATSICENYLSKLEKKTKKFLRVLSVSSTFRRLGPLSAGLVLACRSHTLYTAVCHAKSDTASAHIRRSTTCPSCGLHLIVQKVYYIGRSCRCNRGDLRLLQWNAISRFATYE